MSDLVLADSSRVRFATGAIMYFAQGIPAGLMAIAIPAWLVSQGVSAGDVASYLAVIVLPWAFKLATGPLMDRYRFLVMGNRRPWVLGAQLGLTLSLLGFVFVDDPVEQIGLLMLLGVLINTFAAAQDVAVDGMFIDLTPLDEQGRLNAFMAFGKSVGWSIASAVSGMLLVTAGLGATGVIAALVSAVIFVAFGWVLERKGERRMPWSHGSQESAPEAGPTLGTLLRGVNKALWTRASVFLLLIMFLDGLVGGYGHALMPIAAVKLFGFSTPQWSQLVAVMGLVGAGVALALGPMIDRFGAKRMLFLTVALVALHAILLAETQYLWQDSGYVRVMLSAWIMLGPVTMVCVLALAMALCSGANSATQFAIYMSVANLGSSVGSKLYGVISEGTSYSEAYLTMGVLTLALLGVLAFYRHKRATTPAEVRKVTPRYAAGVGTGRSALFLSGAMRCPKCRSDMDQLAIDSVVVDRCSTCSGLWFDAGEAEKLRDKRVAASLDIGDPVSGEAHNAIDRYRCPRCGGHMIRMVDPKQTHIWYEKCGSCHGSYFDAGEFLDLATFSPSDFFKRFSAQERT